MITDHDIDQIARAMTDGEPSGALRARVMQQLEPRAVHGASAGTFATAAKVLVGLCAVAAAAIFLNRQPAEITPSTVPAQVAFSTPERPGTTGAVSSSTASTAASTTSPRPAQRQIQMSEDERAWQSRRLPALATPDPLALDPIQPEPMSIAPISVDPIVMDPLVVPSVGTRAAGSPWS